MFMDGARVPSGPLAIVHCCRDWTIVLGWAVRRCGLCGQVPEFVRVLNEGEEET